MIEDITDLVTWFLERCGRIANVSCVLGNSCSFGKVDPIYDLADEWDKHGLEPSLIAKRISKGSMRPPAMLRIWPDGSGFVRAGPHNALRMAASIAPLVILVLVGRDLAISLIPKTGEQVKRTAPSASGIVFSHPPPPLCQ